jgi:hypothetical protein
MDQLGAFGYHFLNSSDAVVQVGGVIDDRNFLEA